MSSGDGFSVEVTGLSPNATEKHVHDFFAFSGNVQHVHIIRSGDFACTAYVTFEDAYSQETACLLSGATIVDQRVCITRWGQYREGFDFWSATPDEPRSSAPQRSQFVSDAGEAVEMAQEVVKAMLSKGYILGKDALSKAKDFDESNQVSAKLADTFCAGVEAVKSIDERYGVSDMTKSAMSTVMNSDYFSRGALWVSGALSRASKVAADLGGHSGDDHHLH